MNDITEVYMVIRSKGPGGELYYGHGPHGLGTYWTFNITEALWWRTDSQPRSIVSWENTKESKKANVIKMTKQEYFKRMLKG